MPLSEMDETLRSRSNEFLAELVGELESKARGLRLKTRELQPFVFECAGSITALKAVGIITEEERLEWMHRLATAASLPRASDGNQTVTSTVLGAAEELDGRELDAGVLVEYGADLKRVLPGPPNVIQGLRVISVETYSNSVVIRWRLRSRSVNDFGPIEFKLEDDLGTTYALHHTSERGSVGVVTGEAMFVPAVPSQAGYIEASIGSARFRVPLPS